MSNHNINLLDLLCREFNLLCQRASQQAIREETTVCERLNLLLDLLIAHRTLCERHERGVSSDHQRALSTMLSLKKRQMQGVIRGTDVSVISLTLVRLPKIRDWRLSKGVAKVTLGCEFTSNYYYSK